MTLQDLLNTITSSRPDDWNTIVCWGASTGPSYRNRIEFHEVYNAQPNVLHSEPHGHVAAYKSDLSITMTWGLRENDNFQEPWVNQFANPHASSSFVDVFYNSALVFRTVYVSVDGGRVYLPLPTSQTDLTVPEAYRALIELVDQLSSGTSQFGDYFSRAGMRAVSRPWP